MGRARTPLWLLVATLAPACHCWHQDFLGYVHLKGQELSSPPAGARVGYCPCRDTQEVKLDIQRFEGSACETLLPGTDTLSMDKNGGSVALNGTIVQHWDCNYDLFPACNCKSLVEYYGRGMDFNFHPGCNKLEGGYSVQLSCEQWWDDNNIACLNTNVDAAMYVCDNLPSCDGFNKRQTDDPHTALKHFVDNPSVDTYISRRQCGSIGAGLVRGNYLVCSNTGLNFELAKDTYQLPPFLVAEACNLDPLCSAFTVSNDGQSGKLYQYQEFVDNYNYTAFIKVRHVGVTAPPPAITAATPNTSFLAFPGLRVGEVVNAPHPGCWHCDPIKAGAPGCGQILDSAMLLRMCSGSAECETFRMPSPNTEEMVFSMWTRDEAVTSYIRSDICVPLSVETLDNVFLECTNLDTTRPVLISTYNLPKHLLIEACEWAKCHAVVVRNDNKGGSIFHFNQTATDSYIKTNLTPTGNLTPSWVVTAAVIGILTVMVSVLLVVVLMVVRHHKREAMEESTAVYTRMTS